MHHTQGLCILVRAMEQDKETHSVDTKSDLCLSEFNADQSIRMLDL